MYYEAADRKTGGNINMDKIEEYSNYRQAVKKAYEQSRDIHNNVYFFYDGKTGNCILSPTYEDIGTLIVVFSSLNTLSYSEYKQIVKTGIKYFKLLHKTIEKRINFKKEM